MTSEEQIKRDEAGVASRQQQEQENVYTGSKKRTLARHCKRFWWLHLIIVILIILLVVLLIIFVGIPHIAQQKLNEATLTVQGITVSNTQTDSFTMSINSTITSGSSFSATVEAFTGNMYLEDLEPHTPFALIDFPATQSKSLVAVNISQNVPVTNLDALTTFNAWVLNNQSLRVTISGDTTVRVSGIGKAFGVTFTKTVTLLGLNKFDGLSVTKSNISAFGTFDSEGDNFIGYSTIPNPSPFTFELGNTTFDNLLLGASIGNLSIDDLTIQRGNNNVSIRATIQQAPVLGALSAQPYCADGVLPFALIGQAVVNHGQPLPYFANAFAQLNSSVSVPVGADLEADGINITCPKTGSSR